MIAILPIKKYDFRNVVGCIKIAPLCHIVCDVVAISICNKDDD